MLSQNLKLRVQIIIITFLLIVTQSCGSHGKIVSFNFPTCKDTLERYIHLLNDDSTLHIVDKTDPSNLNRPGYFDIIINQNNLKYQFKMHYYGGTDEYWKANKEECTLSIIAINENYDADLSFFSLEKRNAIKIFEKVIIPRLKDLPKCR